MFTKAELLELRKADKLIDKTFCITAEERKLCNELDREAKDVRKRAPYFYEVAYES